VWQVTGLCDTTVQQLLTKGVDEGACEFSWFVKAGHSFGAAVTDQGWRMHC
jgi:hypothetical protein